MPTPAGDPGPRPVERTSSGSPISPAAMRSARDIQLGSNRRMNAIRKVAFDSAAARATAVASSSVDASGFSQRTCFPAASAATASSACVKVGEAMTTASMSSTPTASSGSVNVRSHRVSAAAAPSASSLGSASAASRAPPTPEAKLRACTSPARPVPTTATASGLVMRLSQRRPAGATGRARRRR